MSRIIEYKGIFYLIFCRSTVSFDNLKNLARHTINLYLKLNRRYFFHVSKSVFLSSEITEYCQLHS